MSGSRIPSEAPPSYSEATATASSTASGSAAASSSHGDTSHLAVPGASSGKNGVPASYRRSMEDEQRPLPPGWVRTYDPSSEHQFFVDTSKDPPRSTWVHPYDDDEYLSSLTSDERERIEQDNLNKGKHGEPTKAELIHSHSDDEDDHHHTPTSAGPSPSSAIPSQLPPRPGGGKGKETDKTFGRKLKDKLTGMTHEERVAERKRQAEAERQMYEQHMRVRQAMTRAMQTGQPQLLGKDRDGKDVYVEPPPPAPYGGYGSGYYGGGGYGYSPWGGSGGPGVYSTPNARYIRPQGPYSRGGSGMGMPLAIGGGLLGGLLIGDMLF